MSASLWGWYDPTLLALCVALDDGLLFLTQGERGAGVGVDLGHKVGAILFLGDGAHALELLLHGDGAHGLGGRGFFHFLFGACVLGHPEEVVIREVGAGAGIH